MSGEAINFFNNFSDLSYKKKVEDKEKQTVNNNNANVTDAVKEQTIFNTKVTPAQKRNFKKAVDEFFAKQENIEHLQQHVVELGKLVQKYEKNPKEALKDESVKVKFSAEEAAEIENLLKDKNSLSAFFAISGYEELTGSDIVEGLKLFNASKKNKKMPFDNMTPDEIAKMDPKKFAKELKKIRKLRKAMKSEKAVKIAAAMVRNPHRCDHYTSILSKRNIYKDEDVEKAVEQMEGLSDDKALKYFDNMNKLEQIKDENNKVKYSGSVIVDVTKCTVDEPKAEEAIMSTAQRKDMDGEHLLGISNNLVLNPLMIPSYMDFLNAKDSSGNDKFGKETLLGQTEYMVPMNKEEINKYSDKVLDYAQYDNISGEDADSYARDVMENPSLELSIDSAVKEAAADYGADYDSYDTKSSGNSNVDSVNTGNFINRIIYKDDDVSTTEEENEDGIDLEKLAEDFKSKYGQAADTMIELCKENPEVIKALFLNPTITFQQGMALIKKYGNNVALISAVAKNPDNIDKIKMSSASITTSQLTELVKVSEKRDIDFVIAMIKKYNPTKAITICNSIKPERINELKLSGFDTRKAVSSKNANENLEEKYHFHRELIA